MRVRGVVVASATRGIPQKQMATEPLELFRKAVEPRKLLGFRGLVGALGWAGSRCCGLLRWTIWRPRGDPGRRTFRMSVTPNRHCVWEGLVGGYWSPCWNAPSWWAPVQALLTLRAREHELSLQALSRMAAVAPSGRVAGKCGQQFLVRHRG